MNEQVVLIATAWGAQHGGINAFNHDLCVALGLLVGDRHSVSCVVPHATEQQRNAASRNRVRLLDFDGLELGSELGPELAEFIVRQVTAGGTEPVRWWIGHDVVTGPVALRARALVPGSSTAVVHHMNYEAYLPFKGGDATTDRKKVELQRAVLEDADRVFAVGTKLAQSAKQKIGGARPEVVELIPGLAEVSRMAGPEAFSAITFGRLGPDDDRIKQARLAVAGFGRARGFPGDPLGPDARLTVIGISDDENDGHRRALLALAEKYSAPPVRRGRREDPRAVVIHGWPYLDDRSQLLDHLRRQSVCLMLSLHEGFGLAGWEAISARVPLIVSRNSGLYETVDRTLGGIGLGCLRSIDVHGSTGEESFQDQDVDAVAIALVEMRSRARTAKRDADWLAAFLGRFCTWEYAAAAVAEACGLTVTKSLANRSLERWTPDYLLNALRDSPDVVQDAARRKHLYDHFWSRLKDQAAHKDLLVLFGGVATSLCDQAAADAYAEWLNSNREAELYICYETGAAATSRARQLEIDPADKSSGLPADTAVRMKAKEQRVLALPQMIDAHLSSDRSINVLARVRLIPLAEPLTTYVMVSDDEIYVTPLLRARSSESLSFLLAQTPVQLRLDVYRYIAHHLRLAGPGQNAERLLARIDETVAKLDAAPPQTPAASSDAWEPAMDTNVESLSFGNDWRTARLADLDEDLSHWISKASAEIVVLGALAERPLPPEWPRLFASALKDHPTLRISVYLESANNRLWRGLLADDASPDGHATTTRIAPTDNAEITQALFDACGDINGGHSDHVTRFTLAEVDVPIYTAFLKIDDRIVMIPRTHVPMPMSCVWVLNDPAQPEWVQAQEAIRHFQRLESRQAFISPVGGEKLTVYSKEGRTSHGPSNRQAFSINPRLETRVVHGLIFARNGKLLLQYRDDSAYDNRHLWDKSFGGNVDPIRDLSLRDAAMRELEEEVIAAMSAKLSAAFDTAPTPRAIEVIDCGSWRGTDGLVPFLNRREWCAFLLKQGVRFPSRRVLPDKTTIDRSLFVDIFVYICSDEFPEQLTPAGHDIKPSWQWVDVDVASDHENFTSDLMRYLQDPELHKDVSAVASAIKTVWTKDE